MLEGSAGSNKLTTLEAQLLEASLKKDLKAVEELRVSVICERLSPDTRHQILRTVRERDRACEAASELQKKLGLDHWLWDKVVALLIDAKDAAPQA